VKWPSAISWAIVTADTAAAAAQGKGKGKGLEGGGPGRGRGGMRTRPSWPGARVALLVCSLLVQPHVLLASPLCHGLMNSTHAALNLLITYPLRA